jgi:hypothetical protein
LEEEPKIGLPFILSKNIGLHVATLTHRGVRPVGGSLRAYLDRYFTRRSTTLTFSSIIRASVALQTQDQSKTLGSL